MINVSSEFHRLMNERTDFRQYAEMTLADGTQMVLTKEDFSVENNNVVDGAETSGIPLGVAVCRHIQIEIDNRDEKYSEVDFFGAKIRLYLTFQLSETEERIEYGTFTVLQPETYGETVIIYALDDMYKADKEYTSSLNYPATLREILIDACSSIDISLGSTSFDNDDFVVDTKPTEITYRQLFGYVAMIAGGNARIDTTGRLRILTYNFNKVDSLLGAIMDGGKYFPWNNGSDLEGGNFIDWDDADNADGGIFGDRKEFHLLNNWSTLKVDTDDVVITGVSTNVRENGGNKEIMYGTEGYVLRVSNPLFQAKEEEALALIGSAIVGGRMRKFSGDLVANPTCEFMDVAIVSDRKGNAYPTILTDINFQFFGFTVLSNSAESAMRNSSETYSAAIETLVAAKKLVEQEKTDRELAVEQLAKDLQTSSGLYMTEKKQADGSVIYYMHDKPTLDDSMVVWKLTSLAFGVSTDGGKTYPYGFTVNGELITKLLYAEGINADYITSGKISTNRLDVSEIANANALTSKYATITSLDAQKARVDTIESNYITASKVSSTYATINNLNAQKSRIDTIESNYISASVVGANFATINSLNAVNANLQNLIANKIDASTVKAQYMEVVNWTSGGYINANKINVNDLMAKTSVQTTTAYFNGLHLQKLWDSSAVGLTIQWIYDTSSKTWFLTGRQ